MEYTEYGCKIWAEQVAYTAYPPKLLAVSLGVPEITLSEGRWLCKSPFFFLPGYNHLLGEALKCKSKTCS